LDTNSSLPNLFVDASCQLNLFTAQARLPPYRFRPLDLASEAPRPGMLLGLDAEFVMVGVVA
jgi:hypothetical protein